MTLTRRPSGLSGSRAKAAVASSEQRLRHRSGARPPVAGAHTARAAHATAALTTRAGPKATKKACTRLPPLSALPAVASPSASTSSSATVVMSARSAKTTVEARRRDLHTINHVLSLIETLEFEACCSSRCFGSV
ncbi:hypothetical protein CXG81DRAFT_24937 [Caulochytrium protostelioides]|uniref:Uncharacterized protein n=1 Tax=Caulochytrium protostelioides TaxID=1555241 RepID=A0A4P9XAJ1_9FUNG|nr:hypothetical protein CXG81DRAFT_24937 [Caulochytrium protostelioides]|eukprot:RKP02393.1 hypothetical protein CXG81DRAFT_24937 [Caulochytrium protostelioides]